MIGPSPNHLIESMLHLVTKEDIEQYQTDAYCNNYPDVIAGWVCELIVEDKGLEDPTESDWDKYQRWLVGAGVSNTAIIIEHAKVLWKFLTSVPVEAITVDNLPELIPGRSRAIHNSLKGIYN